MAPDFALLKRIDRRALAQMVAMIYRANHRADALPRDPKVGGHPAACASCIEILSTLHLLVREPEDFLCAKPHASPVDHVFQGMLGLMRHKETGAWFKPEEIETLLDQLRAFPQDGEPVLQSYHSEFDPDGFRWLPSGSVGIPPVNSVYLALAYRYANTHGWSIKQPHFWSLIGDSEFREGSLPEVLPEAAERELGNVTWIIDYNRQSLDGTRTPNADGLQGNDADRIEGMCAANGWEVIQLRHDLYRREVFAKKGGAGLRKVFETSMSDFQFQTLLWKRDAEEMREALVDHDPKSKKLVQGMSDKEIKQLFFGVGGHDIERLNEAMLQSKIDTRRPTVIIAHTIKGNHLSCAAATGNHSSLPGKDEVVEQLSRHELTYDRPYTNFAEGSDEAAFLAERGAYLRKGIEALDEEKANNLARVKAAIDAVGDLPDTLDINLKLAPLTNTQWMWGQCASKLVRIGAHEELTAAGKPAGKELGGDELRWNAVADMIMTMAPDVGTSTNINPAMDQKIFGPGSQPDWEKKLEIKQRMRPSVAPTDAAYSRHVRFEIAEANCMSANGSFGKMGDAMGIPFLPMMTIYDFFIKRALDQLYYNLYWDAGFVILGTPSGVTLSAEGAQHSWKSDLQIPNLVTWEPSFAKELDWILCDAIKRHFHRDNTGRKGVLIRATTMALHQKTLIESLRRQARYKQELPAGAQLCIDASDGGLPEAEVPAIADEEIFAALRKDVLEGGYYLIDYRGYKGYEPGENVVHIFTMGSLVEEAITASQQLLARGIYANVLIASSTDLLIGLLGRKNDYHHLRQTLDINGDLHLQKSGQVTGSSDAIDLAGRRTPIVSVHDGEEGLMDNIGSIVGVKQEALAVRRFSKSGNTEQIFKYHSIDASSIVEACGKALSATALERVRLTRDALAVMEGQQQDPTSDWKKLWPNPAQ